jgi:hypothetical protein
MNGHIILWYYSSLREKYPNQHLTNIILSKTNNLVIDNYTIEDSDREYIFDILLKKIINGT